MSTSANQPTEKKPLELVAIKLKNLEDGKDLHFQVTRNTRLKKLMEFYCARKLVQLESVRFTYDGKRVKGRETPEDLNMDNTAVIDVFVEQFGGSIH